jgi:hypothetical protein
VQQAQKGAKSQPDAVPRPFVVDDATSKWFDQYVRQDVIVELSKLLGTSTKPLPVAAWPDARSIIYDIGGPPARLLREFLKRFQDRTFLRTPRSLTPRNPVDKPAGKLPAWQAALCDKQLQQPGYHASGRPPLEWQYLRALARSSLLDIAVYERFRRNEDPDHPYSLAADKLPVIPDGHCARIVARTERVFTSAIPPNWLNNEATRRYQSDLDYYAKMWHSTMHDCYCSL